MLLLYMFLKFFFIGCGWFGSVADHVVHVVKRYAFVVMVLALSLSSRFVGKEKQGNGTI